MEDDEYRPRPKDHLVEPFFAGLGQEEPEERENPPPRNGCGGLVALLVLILVAL
jgi:hypothetical protein